MAVYDDGAQPFSQRATSLVNYAGAACSLALMVGIGFWGYELIKRDVSGIPVVRAVEGDMRVAPDNPGGEVAAHTGLAVNAVAAEGEAAGFEDTLLLAPRTQQLAEEDLAVQPTAEAGEVAPVEDDTAAVEVSLTETLPEEQAPMSADEILALADRLATGVEPIDAPVEPEVAAAEEAVPAEPEVEVIAASVPGVSTSLRPFVRPVSLSVPVSASAQVDEAVAAALASASANTGPNNSEVSVLATELPVGTKLVQLGAFPTPQDAAEVWANLQGRFGDYLVSKERVIQVAERGSSTFYRLRAMGFDDLTDARRFCAALEAGNAECIPVVIR
ncbi:Sporulation related domain-containing protein [Cognatiyoonia sediminum]|uniref:Sporulation related domain-containing protein n=1 Tax=Cognatiyoonia sediminum TaxID=1508389 RepID=A0A1M5LUK6_9RHOB|nr:SPOR domain-containing protein [Cognatiyoonia sediminum]SHG68738.1 Sporulation related domain-containing protein [Cognatiyoonia sediminum]